MLKLPKTIKWVITDFDGVVTDNYVYINDEGSMSRRVNFKDIIGFYMLYKSGINVGIISGEENAVINLLQKRFDLKEVHTKIHNKIDVLKALIEKYNLSDEEYLYIGDDINDLECLKLAKYKVTVPDAAEELLNTDGIQITQKRGGSGAFREVADCLRI
ncbi:MAG: HAD hydrolase family protein [Candidatus Gastranaerophilaceae bacterium]|nr:HAD hydrolase family protein [Candidatus Gastranaerophilaceae bacterium]